RQRSLGTALLFSPTVRDLNRDRRGLGHRHALRPALVLLLRALVADALLGIRDLFLLTRKLDAQLLDEHHDGGGNGEREKCAQDTHQRAARKEREENDGRGK